MSKTNLYNFNQKVIDRILKRVIIPDDESECWLCDLSKAYGYCKIEVNKKKLFVHRIMLINYSGEQHLELIACHSCRNRNCCNPNHLRWGTHADNQNDRIKDDTDNQGEKNGGSKLTEEEVKQIFYDNRKYRIIADEMCVDRKTIYNIKRGKRWRHLNLPQ